MMGKLWWKSLGEEELDRQVERVEEKVQQVQQGTRWSAGVEQDVNVIWTASHPF
jgi:hypothetical protein